MHEAFYLKSLFRESMGPSITSSQTYVPKGLLPRRGVPLVTNPLTAPIPEVVPRYVVRPKGTERGIHGTSQISGPGSRLARYVLEACPGAGGALYRECPGPSCPLPGRIGRVRRAGCRYNPLPAQFWSAASVRSPASPVGNKEMAKIRRSRRPPARWLKVHILTHIT